jgi:hypothetical protein
MRERMADLELIAQTWAKSEEEGNPWGVRVTDGKIVLWDGDTMDEDIVLEKDQRTGLPLLTTEARAALKGERHAG